MMTKAVKTATGSKLVGETAVRRMTAIDEERIAAHGTGKKSSGKPKHPLPKKRRVEGIKTHGGVAARHGYKFEKEYQSTSGAAAHQYIHPKTGHELHVYNPDDVERLNKGKTKGLHPQWEHINSGSFRQYGEGHTPASLDKHLIEHKRAQKKADSELKSKKGFGRYER